MQVRLAGAANSPHPNNASQVCQRERVVVEIGGIPILLTASDPGFCRLIEERYAGFLNRSARPAFEFDVLLRPPVETPEEDLRVFKLGSRWRLLRGDFRAEWDVRSRRGWIRQSANPYSLDTVLRVVHSLILVDEGGLLVHAASAVRGGRAFLFAGVSGAGKTTIARLAPPDVSVLTDEISYVRLRPDGFEVYGTPFAGELARVGENLSAPLDTLYFLEKGPENATETVGALEATRKLLRHVLFFAQERDGVQHVLDAALELVSRVKVRRMVFTPDERAWEQVR